MSQLSCNPRSGNITTAGQPGLDLDGVPRENLGCGDSLVDGMARLRPVFRSPFIERVEEISDEMMADHQSYDDCDDCDDETDENEDWGEILIRPRDRYDEMWEASLVEMGRFGESECDVLKYSYGTDSLGRRNYTQVNDLSFLTAEGMECNVRMSLGEIEDDTDTDTDIDTDGYGPYDPYDEWQNPYFDQDEDEEEDTSAFDDDFEDCDSFHSYDYDDEYDPYDEEDDGFDHEGERVQALMEADLFNKAAACERSSRVENTRYRCHRSRWHKRVTIKPKREIETLNEQEIRAWMADRLIMQVGSKMFWTNPDIWFEYQTASHRREKVIDHQRQGEEFSSEDYDIFLRLSKRQKKFYVLEATSVSDKEIEDDFEYGPRDHWYRRRPTSWKYRKGAKAQWDRGGTQRRVKKEQNGEGWVDLGTCIVLSRYVRAIHGCLARDGRVAPQLYDRMIERLGCGTVIDILKYLGIEAYNMEHRHYEMAAK